jgi:hypothetical protein
MASGLETAAEVENGCGFSQIPNAAAGGDWVAWGDEERASKEEKELKRPM